MVKYLVLQGNRVLGIYDSFVEAIKVLGEVGGGEIYRGELITRLSGEEALEIKDHLVTSLSEPVEAPIKPRKKYVVILDTMYDEYYVNKLREKFPLIEVYRIVLGEFPRTNRREGVVEAVVENELDILHLVDELFNKGYQIIFFTGNKKLYTRLSMLYNIMVFYKPLNKYSSREELIESIIEELGRIIEM